MIEEHANYIDGTWRPALLEHVFEVSAAGDRGRPMARFPRSSARDVEAAVSACASAEHAWQSLAVEERSAIVMRALAALSEDPDPEDRVAQCLGLEPDEMAGDRDALGRSLESLMLRARAAAHLAPGGVEAVQLHWSELWAGPVYPVLSALLAGRAVLLLSDPHVPFVAERIARALDAGALPRGVLALVHDDRDTCLDALLGDPRVDFLRASGPKARVREIERCVHRQRARDVARDDRSTSPPTSRRRVRFGAGIDDRSGPELELELLRNTSYVVTRDADPAESAAEVLERAFGRAKALSGQRPGSIGRVLCHQRQFSRFTSELLARLERSPDAAAPLAAREAAELEHVRRAGELGLDEGATLVHSRSEGAARSGAPAPSRERRAEAMLWPAVFTNVEEHMRIAWLGRPAPVLCLMRVASDERGAALAQEIDRDPLAEDLSTTPDEPAAALEEQV